MKRLFFLLSIAFFVNTVSSTVLMAQGDDLYYDPKTDKANQYSAPQNTPANPNNNSGVNQPAEDKTDGYGNTGSNPAYRYDEKDKSYSQTYQDDNLYAANGYSDDYEDYYYTGRLRRYYAPNFGVNYYSYWFTPSFYFGWNNWNTGVYVTYSPWYNDPWWRWNRPRNSAFIVYDPWYDPYWDYNWGWNSCSYYNSWSNPWGGFCSTFGWGYNPYSWNIYNCGWGRHGWGNRYHNNYWSGYNNGYWHGYNDGYWNSYGYNPYYYRHRYSGGRQGNQPNQQQPPQSGVNRAPGVAVPLGNQPIEKPVNIPREGLTKPFMPEQQVKTEQLVPSKGIRPSEVTPAQPNPNIQQWDNSNKINPQPGLNNNVPRQNENNIQQVPSNRNWDQQRDVTPARPQENIQRIPPQQMQQPQIIQQPRNFDAPRNQPDRRNPEPRQNIERIEPQMRNMEPRNREPEQPRFRNIEPRQNIQREEPRQNFQRIEPQQRNFEQPRMQMREASPAIRMVEPQQFRNVNPSIGGGGGRKPH